MTGLTIQQQRAIAIANARARGASPAPAGSVDPYQPLAEQGTLLGRGANESIADVAGLPLGAAGDLYNLGAQAMEQMIGGISGAPVTLDRTDPAALANLPREGMVAAGMLGEEQTPQTVASNIGSVLGDAATMMLAPGAAAGRVLGQEAVSTGGRIVRDVVETMVNRPGATVAGEIVASTGAGVGATIAQQVAPDDPGAQALGEIIGGLTPAGLASGILGVTRLATNGPVVGTLRDMFSTRIGHRRAGARLQAMTGDISSALANLDAEHLPGLTIAQRTGDQGLLSLERSVIEASQQDVAEASQQIADMTRSIYQSLRFEGDPQATAQTLTEAQNYLRSLLEARVQIAAQAAAERIARIGPEASREAVNVAAHEELTAALSAARAQEGELWSQVPMDVTVPATESRAVMEQLLASTPRAQRRDIPSIARSILSDAEEDVPEGFGEAYRAFGLAETGFGNEMPITELQGLRSRMLEDARIARANGQRNTARIMDQIADAIMRDMDAVEEVSGPIRLAMDFSRALNDRFTRGPVGRLLGYAREGDFRVDPRLTLERSAGRGDVTGAVEQDALLAAAGSPEMRAALDGYLRHRFMRQARTDDGQLKDTAARTFLARHEQQLEQFPELRAEIQEAINANNASLVLRNRVQQQIGETSDPRVSSAAVYLAAPPNRELDRVASSANPGQVMLDLVQTVSRDPTGEALQGLKVSFGDYLLRQASTRTATQEGDFIISGLALRRMLREGPAAEMAAALMSPAERANLAVIAETAARVEAAAASRPAQGGIISDAPGQIRSALAGIVGAAFGRAIPIGGSNIQKPGIMANLFRRLQSMGMNDPARRLLVDAMRDEELFRALATLPNTPERQRFVNRTLNAWMLSVARDMGQGLAAEFDLLGSEGSPEDQ